MIRPLRRTHGVVFIVLAILLPLLLILALSGRPDVPVNDRVPASGGTSRGGAYE